MSDELLNHALALARRGWPVFPCHPETKQPLLKATAEERAEARGGLKKATVSEDIIATWWARWPKAMIGVPTGAPIGAFVIDIDAGADKDTGEIFEYGTLLKNLCDAIGARLPRTVISETPRGGRHHFFAMPLGPDGKPMKVANRAGLTGKGSRVDVRGDGGYVIVPPSTREDGRSYGWLVAPTDRGFAAPPDELLDCVLRRGKWGAAPPRTSAEDPARPAKSDQGATSRGDVGDVDQVVRKYALAALEAEKRNVSGAREGTRNDALNIAALKLFELEAAGVLSEREIHAALEDAAEASGLAKDDGWPSVRATIASGARKGKSQPRDLAEIRAKAAQRGPRRKTGAAPTRGAPADPPPPDRAPSDASSSSSPSSPHPSAGEEKTGATLADDQGEPPAEETISEDTFRHCAALDQSDTDNGKRLIAYFGRDLLVRQEDDVPAGQWLAWTGTHWDLAAGDALAELIAQRVGDMIKDEARYMDFTDAEARAVHAGDEAKKTLKHLDQDSDEPDIIAKVMECEAAIGKAEKARAALNSRKTARRKFAVQSKNRGRIAAMLACAAPHLRRHPDAFNADPLKVATATHTLRFVPAEDPEDPEAEGKRPLVDRATGKVQYRLVATKGHDRADLLTAVIPFAYDPNATAAEFAKFLDLFQPELEKRRTLQSYSGMGVTAQPVQRIMFHTGTGGNGKSVFLEVMARVLGDGLAVGVPAETVSGVVQNNPSAPTPDIARCYGKRYLRIAELPPDAPLKQETIKKLTGGERWPVRTMYKGYFEFKPTAKPHMSGNGEPKIDGSDGGLKRRLDLMPWSVTLPVEKHRDFEEVVSEMAAEGSGILNWLLAGALDFLNHGLVLSKEVQTATAEYFRDNDPCEQFIAAHVRQGGEGVQARKMYEAYKVWCEVNGKPMMREARFGKVMKKKIPRDDTGRVHIYLAVDLHDVPESPSAQHGGAGPPPHEPDDVPRF